MNVQDEARKLLERDSAFPGCYDEPEFLALEKRDSAAALEAYGRFVVERPVAVAEATRVRRVVGAFAQAVVAHASPDEIRGQCVNLSSALLKVLEAHGCWAFAMRGSVRIRFPRSSRLDTQYLRILDPANVPGLIDGHAWVVCPPFEIIDLSLRVQRWRGAREQEQYVPAIIAAESAVRVPFQPDLWAPPARPSVPGYPPPGRVVKSLWSWWPSRVVDFGNGADCTFQTHGVTVPDSPLDDCALKIGGASVGDFYRSVVLPDLRDLEPR